ncbi:MAG: hypothetical protein HY906_16755 [Deltaproteobacteria bacterium]|nr:hypothetical protein [Deltaproteobacteria bacterium]
MPAIRVARVVAAVSVVVTLAGACSSTNHAPSITSIDVAPQPVTPGGSVSVAVTAVDPEGDPLTYAWTVPTGWTVTGGRDTAVLTLEAPTTFAESAGVIVTVTDSKGHSAASQAIVSTIADEAPTFDSLTATPNPVAPGGQALVVAVATSPVGNPITYSWTSSDATWTLAGSEGSATLTAPDTYGAATTITVVADDGAWMTATARVPVATLAHTQLAVTSITATPAPVQPGGAMTLSAAIANPDGLALTYAWSVVDTSWTITPNGARATLVAPGLRNQTTIATLTVTDAAGGTATGSVIVSTTGGARPTAVIAGTPPLAGVVNTRLALDGSGSTSPVPTTLLYGWTVTSKPAGATATFVDSTGMANANIAQPFFLGDTAGTYGIQLQVGDAQDPANSAFATTSVVLSGATTLTIVSGDGQTGPVGADLPLPLVVKVATGGGAGVPNVDLRWDVTNGTGFFSTTITGADGQSWLSLRTPRLAADGTVKVSLVKDPTVTATFTFHAVAARAASINVRGDVGTTDGPITVTVQVVDQFGNPATDNVAANTSRFHLDVTSGSGNARFQPGGGPVTSLDAQLVGGVFTVPLTDTMVEAATITISPTPTAGLTVLPFTAWTIEAYDNAELGIGNWTRTGSPTWQVATGAARVESGWRSFGMELFPSEVVSPEGSMLRRVAALINPLALVKLEFRHKATVPTVAATDLGCAAQPLLLVGRWNGASFVTKQPVGGYPVRTGCANPGLAPSYATTDWVAQTFDLTDDVTGAGNQYAAYYLQNPLPTRTPASAASWYVDQIKLTRFATTSSFVSAAANASFTPGAAVKVQFTADDFTPAVAYGSCLSGLQGLAVGAVILDAHNNVTWDSEMIYRLTWDGAAVLTGLTTGTLLATGTHQADLQFNGGQAAVTFTDATVETVNFGLQNPNAYPGIDVSDTAIGTASTWYCHHAWGANAPWSDGTPLDTYTQVEAARACEEYRRWNGGAGGCDTDPDYPNAAHLLLFGWNYFWTYGAGGTVAQASGACRQWADAACTLTLQCPSYTAGAVFRIPWTASCFSGWRLCGGINYCQAAYTFTPNSSALWH